jgi:hypothetical protein
LLPLHPPSKQQLQQWQGQQVLQSHTSMLCAAFVGLLQTIHWLRYGCLPVFVIEGQTPAAKLEKLRQR